jgi:hypothetical protein
MPVFEAYNPGMARVDAENAMMTAVLPNIRWNRRKGL